MSAAYREAAEVLKVLLSRKRGLRAAALAPHVKNKRKVLALVSRTLQHQHNLERAVAATRGAQKKLVAAIPNRSMRLLLLFDLLLGAGKISGGGKAVRAVKELQAPLAKLLAPVKAAIRAAEKAAADAEGGIESLRKDLLGAAGASKPRYVRVNTVKTTLQAALLELTEFLSETWKREASTKKARLKSQKNRGAEKKESVLATTSSSKPSGVGGRGGGKEEGGDDQNNTSDDMDDNDGDNNGDKDGNDGGEADEAHGEEESGDGNGGGGELGELGGDGDVDDANCTVRDEELVAVDAHVLNLVKCAPLKSLLFHAHPRVVDGSWVLQDKASCFSAEAMAGPGSGMWGTGERRGEDAESTGTGTNSSSSATNSSATGSTARLPSSSSRWLCGDVLDACAAPGNKTSHLAALLHAARQGARQGPQGAQGQGPQGGQGLTRARVLAFDRDPVRLRTLQERVSLAGCCAPPPPLPPPPSSSSAPDIWDGGKSGEKKKKMKSKKNKQGEQSQVQPGALVEAKCFDFLSSDPAAPEFRNLCAVLLDPSCSGSGITENHLDRLVDRARQGGKEAGGGGGGGGGGADKGNGKRDNEGGGGDGGVGSKKKEEEGEGAGGDLLLVNERSGNEKIAGLVRFQKAALRKAMSFPQVSRIVYSTCSVHVAENEGVVAAVLRDPTGTHLDHDDEDDKDGDGGDGSEGGDGHEKKEKAEQQLGEQLGEQISAGDENEFVLVRVLPGWHRRGLPGAGGLSELETECVVRADPSIDHTHGFFVACLERRRVRENSAWAGGGEGEGGGKSVVVVAASSPTVSRLSPKQISGDPLKRKRERSESPDGGGHEGAESSGGGECDVAAPDEELGSRQRSIREKRRIKRQRQRLEKSKPKAM